MRTPTRLALSAGVLASCFAVVTLTRIGPVILVLSESHGHGVHLGDLVTIPMGLFAVALLLPLVRRKRV